MTFDALRARMVEEQLRARGIQHPRVLSAFLAVPRHAFVPSELQADAYEDRPLPIGNGQTVSQPYIVALMLELLHLEGHERVLEIGTGSGYELALLSHLALEVYSVKRIPGLAVDARDRLNALGYLNIEIGVRNGTLGWQEHAPYDAILVSAGAPEVPTPLLEQLADPGRLVIPVGSADAQTLTLILKEQNRLTAKAITSCAFVPLVGEYGWPE